MSTTEIRDKLLEYIRTADDKKVRAIYTVIENEIEEDTDLWTDEFLEELSKRSSEFENEKVERLSWEEVRSRAREYAKGKQR